MKQSATLDNLDKAYYVARDCRHFETCERAMPEIPAGSMVWQMDKCERFEKKETEK